MAEQTTNDADALRRSIEAALGSFPSYFVPAQATPDVLADLWANVRRAELESPVPRRCRARLRVTMALLTRVPSTLVTEACALHADGEPAARVLVLLRRPLALDDAEEQRVLRALAATEPLTEWPVDASLVDVLHLAAVRMTQPMTSSCQMPEALRLVLGSRLYAALIACISSIRATHAFADAYPRVDEGDVVAARRRALMAEEPVIAGVLEEHARDRERPLRDTPERRRHLEERLLLAIEAARMGTWDYNPLTHELAWDARCREIFGVASEVPVSLATFTAGLPDDEKARVNELATRALDPRGDGRYAVELHLLERPEVTERFVASSGRVIFEEGRAARFVGTALDVTEQRLTEQRLRDENRLNRTLSRVGSALAGELDRVRLVQLVTDELTDITGAAFGAFFVPREESPTVDAPDALAAFAVAGAPPLEESQAVLQRVAPVVSACLGEDRAVRVDDVLIDSHARPLDVAAGFDPRVRSCLVLPVIGRKGVVFGALFLAHGEVAHFTSSQERIGVGIAAQAAIAFENARLYQALREEQSKTRAALDRATLADRRKDEFLAMLSHELRNPLAAIVTALQLLKLRGSGKTREHQVVERQVNHLKGLVEDVLDVSRVMRGKIELAPEMLDIGEAVRDALEMVAPLMEERRHRVDVDVAPGRVRADRVRLAQVLANLLGNAAKYTPRQGHIRVVSRTQGEWVRVEVIDSGVGIDADTLAQLFQPFAQARRPLDRAEGGLGLGLALVKGLVELHGGTVSAESDGVGRGSRFLLELPRGDEVEGASMTGTPVFEEPSATGVRVLVVDDNEDAADVLADLLRSFGHEVAVAYDGPQALSMSAAFHPSVAVLDIGLPVMDGYELATKLRETEGRALRLYAVTGYGQADDLARSQAAGFDAHFVKPVDPLALEAVVRAPPPADP